MWMHSLQLDETKYIPRLPMLQLRRHQVAGRENNHTFYQIHWVIGYGLIWLPPGITCDLALAHLTFQLTKWYPMCPYECYKFRWKLNILCSGYNDRNNVIIWFLNICMSVHPFVLPSVHPFFHAFNNIKKIFIYKYVASFAILWRGWYCIWAKSDHCSTHKT